MHQLTCSSVLQNVPVETSDEAAAAPKPGKKAKQSKGKDKQADKQQQQQQASDKKRKRGDAADGADSDMAALKARLAQLEAENAQLKKAKKQKAGTQKPDAVAGAADTATVAKKEQKKGKQQQQQQQPKQAAPGKEGAAGEPAADGEAAAGEVKLSKTAARKLALQEARKAKKAARKEAKQAAKQPAAPNKQQQHAAAAEAAAASTDMRAWAPYCLHPVLLGSLALQGFSKPTPIQQECMQPAMRDQLDIIGAAQTGSGKTLAFGLPILQKLLREREAAGAAEEAEEAEQAAEQAADGEDEGEEGREEEEAAGGRAGTRAGKGQGSPLRALILCPTRELALQVSWQGGGGWEGHGMLGAGRSAAVQPQQAIVGCRCLAMLASLAQQLLSRSCSRQGAMPWVYRVASTTSVLHAWQDSAAGIWSYHSPSALLHLDFLHHSIQPHFLPHCPSPAGVRPHACARASSRCARCAHRGRPGACEAAAHAEAAACCGGGHPGAAVGADA